MENLMQASTQWANRPADEIYETPEALLTAVKSRQSISRSAIRTLDKVQFEQDLDGNLVVMTGGQETYPTHWGFGQLGAAIKAPVAYLRRKMMPTKLLLDNLRWAHSQAGNPTHKFLTLAGARNVFQALTGPDYGRIWDADVVTAVMDAVKSTGDRFYNPKAYTGSGEEQPRGLYASDHDVFMFMIDGGSVFDIGPRAQINRGFFVWNSEVGAKTFGAMTFLFNIVCGNHIVWDATNINKVLIRHTKGGPARFQQEIYPMLQAFMNSSEAPVKDAVKKAMEYRLPDDEEEKLTFLRDKGFQVSEAKAIVATAVEEEGQCDTLWDAVQGGTAYARGFEHTDTRVAFETRVGKLLDMVK